MKPEFFAGQADFLRWLEQNHASETEILVGFYKTGSGRTSITWPESVEAALRFGWIDAVRRRIDDVSYSIRFTRRKPGSIWSAVNVRHVEELIERKQMYAAGLEAFRLRSPKRTAVYSFEQKEIAFAPAQRKLFSANKAAWKFFGSRPGWYRRAATWWVVNAKREETRTKRLATLIADSAAGQTLKHLTR